MISYVYDLPFGHGQRYMCDATGVVDKLVSGWGVDGVTTFQKGFPLKLLGWPVHSPRRRSALASQTFGQTRSQGAAKGAGGTGTAGKGERVVQRQLLLRHLPPMDTVQKPALTPAFVRPESTTGTSPCSRRRPSARKRSLAFSSGRSSLTLSIACSSDSQAQRYNGDNEVSGPTSTTTGLERSLRRPTARG